MPQQASPLSLAQMGRSFMARPLSAPPIQLPREAPNRPIGKDWLSDGLDALLGGLGLNDPLNPAASKATQIGGLFSAALPLSKLGKLGKAAADLEHGFTLPRARAPMTEQQMNEFLALHGGTLGAEGRHPIDVARTVESYYGPSLAAMRGK